MYRIFKDIIYKTNYRNLERDLLQRINFEIIVRFLLLGCSQISVTDKSVVKQLQRINILCLGLFNTLLLASERTIVQRLILGNNGEQESEVYEIYTTAIVEDDIYKNIKARSKLAVKQARQTLKLPQYSREAGTEFYTAITTAFRRDYKKPNVDLFYKVLLQQQKTVLFDDP